MRKYITRPKVGDMRVVDRFILFPKTLQDQEGNWVKRWYENVRILQQYRAGAGQDDHNRWVDSLWTIG